MSSLAFLLALAAASPADSLATIQGRVRFSNGEPAAYANVVVEQTRRGCVADEQGRFRVDRVPVGTRRIAAFLPGEDRGIADLQLAPGDTAVATIVIGRVSSGKAPATRVATGDLEVEIIPASPHFKVYEPLEFEVRIHNRGSRPVILMRPNVNRYGRNGPQMEFDISAPFYAFQPIRSDGVAFCGGFVIVAQGSSRDFVEIQQGESFDPYRGRTPPELQGRVPTRPGKYTATFRYSTLSPHFGEFAEGGPEIRALVTRVPAVELVARKNFKVDF